MAIAENKSIFIVGEKVSRDLTNSVPCDICLYFWYAAHC